MTIVPSLPALIKLHFSKVVPQNLLSPATLKCWIKIPVQYQQKLKTSTRLSNSPTMLRTCLRLTLLSWIFNSVSSPFYSVYSPLPYPSRFPFPVICRYQCSAISLSPLSQIILYVSSFLIIIPLILAVYPLKFTRTFLLFSLIIPSPSVFAHTCRPLIWFTIIFLW